VAIELVVIELTAALLAPELRLKLLASQLEHDGIRVVCYSALPRENTRRALKHRGILQIFDGLLYEEIMSGLASSELRQLADPATYWMREPAAVDYLKVLPLLSKRQRLLPKVLRVPKLSLDNGDIITEDPE